MNKALFLDRDGIINIDSGHVYKKEEFEFSEGIFELCRNYAKAGYLILVVTNQAGIAKGYYTEKDFFILTEWMVARFAEEGVAISKVYYCPHHPDITGVCDCRKPNPGMINKAVADFNLDIKKCVLIGDKESDIQAGRNAGIQEQNLIFTTSVAMIKNCPDA